MGLKETDPFLFAPQYGMRARTITVERVKGIEPSYAAWEAAVLPLNYTRYGGMMRALCRFCQNFESNTSDRDAKESVGRPLPHPTSFPTVVIPAKVGITEVAEREKMDSRFRGNNGSAPAPSPPRGGRFRTG